VEASLAEAASLPWRRRTTERTLLREGRKWTLWTFAVAGQFILFGAVLLALEPLTAPFAALLFFWAWLVPHLGTRRGVRPIVPIGSERSAARSPGADPDAERAALGLLGDLLGHEQRELAAETGLALQRGRLGTWLVGEQGAIMVRHGGRRADCWCVRVGEDGDLPAGDRVAHLLLALREDEGGFATVANFGFSGWTRRVRRGLPPRSRPALDAARRVSGL
jgi:hypothetical protein